MLEVEDGLENVARLQEEDGIAECYIRARHTKYVCPDSCFMWSV